MLQPHQLAEWSGGTWVGPSPSEIGGVCIDTRRLRPGDLFFALRGEDRDGHAFVAEAFAKGACAAVISDRRTTVSPGRACFVVGDTLTALQRMAAGYRKAVNPRVIGITGSVGKSTVKEMTACMLSTQGVTGSTSGNWNNHIGLPLSLLSMDASARIGVFEMGINHPGEMQVLCDIAQPDCAIVTCIGPVHTAFFESVQSIAVEKATLLTGVPPGGLAVLNKDDEYFDFLRSQAGCEVRTVSVRQAADYACVRWNPMNREAVVLERQTGEQAILNLPLPGAFNVANALLAAAMARSLDVPWPCIREALRQFKGTALRWEELDVAGLHVVNDAYNANPMNMRGALRVFEDEPGGQDRWLVLAGMLELGAREEREHVELGRRVAKGPWSGLIVIGELGGLIAEGAVAAGLNQAKVFRCKSNAEALSVLRENAAQGSRVLFKGSRRFHLESIVEQLASR